MRTEHRGRTSAGPNAGVPPRRPDAPRSPPPRPPPTPLKTTTAPPGGTPKIIESEDRAHVATVRNTGQGPAPNQPRAQHAPSWSGVPKRPPDHRRFSPARNRQSRPRTNAAHGAAGPASEYLGHVAGSPAGAQAIVAVVRRHLTPRPPRACARRRCAQGRPHRRPARRPRSRCPRAAPPARVAATPGPHRSRRASSHDRSPLLLRRAEQVDKERGREVVLAHEAPGARGSHRAASPSASSWRRAPTAGA